MSEKDMNMDEQEVALIMALQEGLRKLYDSPKLVLMVTLIIPGPEGAEMFVYPTFSSPDIATVIECLANQELVVKPDQADFH